MDTDGHGWRNWDPRMAEPSRECGAGKRELRMDTDGGIGTREWQSRPANGEEKFQRIAAPDNG